MPKDRFECSFNNVCQHLPLVDNSFSLLSWVADVRWERRAWVRNRRSWQHPAMAATFPLLMAAPPLILSNAALCFHPFFPPCNLQQCYVASQTAESKSWRREKIWSWFSFPFCSLMTCQCVGDCPGMNPGCLIQKGKPLSLSHNLRTAGWMKIFK